MAFVTKRKAKLMVAPPPLACCVRQEVVEDPASAATSQADKIAQPDMVAQFPCVGLGVVLLLDAEKRAQLGKHQAKPSADL